ncbi:hypothetical protein L1987_79308 [Smallanthus sonchifolius]|uniref:Uncharacterized protein n=1 Tax=Smallanthus sonchifolius TaxID=185202 RepID=A0ACB8ZG53_9ASTR|nr:hypothetical protein L1987_79308 [Smallanthus sonchifolius]
MGYNSNVLNRIDGALAYLVGGNGEYFRGGDFGSIQGVAQCVQDLSLSDCQDCLSEASGRLRSECETSTWGDMYLGKCYIRYAHLGIRDSNMKKYIHVEVLNIFTIQVQTKGYCAEA